MAIGLDIVSAWGFRREFQAGQRLFSQSSFEDVDNADGAVWTDWWFGTPEPPEESLPGFKLFGGDGCFGWKAR